MGAVETLEAERAEIATRLRAKADQAIAENGGQFTDAQLGEVDTLKRSFVAKTQEILRAKSLAATRDDIDALLGTGTTKASSMSRNTYGGRGRSAGFVKGARSNPTPLARLITSQLFGGRALGVSDRPTTREPFDQYGRNVQAVSPFTSSSGKASILTGLPTVPGAPSSTSLTTTAQATRVDDGGQTVLLSEPGIQIAPLLQQAEINNGQYEYVRQNGTSGQSDAEFVPPLGTKPSSAFQYQRISERVRTVAVLSDPIAKQDLEDVAMMPQDVGSWLAWQVAREVDRVIIAGNSTVNAEEPNGILHTSGVLDQPFVTDALLSIRTAITTLESKGVLPTAIAIDPVGWQAVEMSSGTDGHPIFAGQYGDAVARTLFGFPVIVSDVVPAGTAIVADWLAGALAIRTSMEVSWSDTGKASGTVDLYETNAIRFRAEQRLGVSFLRPDHFVVTHTQAVTP